MADVSIGIEIVLDAQDAISGLGKVQKALEGIKKAFEGMPSYVTKTMESITTGSDKMSESTANWLAQLQDRSNQVVESQDRVGKSFLSSADKLDRFLIVIDEMRQRGDVSGASMRELASDLGMTGSEAKNAQNFIYMFGNVAGATGESLRVLHEYYKDGAGLLERYAAKAQGAAMLVRLMGHASTMSASELEGLTKMTGLSEQQLRSYSQELNKVSRGLEVNRRFHMLLASEIKPTTRVVENFTRQLFWSGLGMMFTYMSLARLTRRQAQLQAESYNLARASISVKDAQKELNEVTWEYGARSDEAIKANRRLKESQMALKQKQDMVTASTEQQAFASMMLIFGVFPTWLRTGASIGEMIRNMTIAQQAETGSVMQRIGVGLLESKSIDEVTAKKVFGVGVTKIGTQAELESMGVATAHIPVTSMLGNAFKILFSKQILVAIGFKMIIGAATMGLSLLASYMISQYMVAQSMKGITEEAKRLELELTGHSLVDSFEDLNYTILNTSKYMRDAKLKTRELAQEIVSLPLREHSPLEVRTRQGWATLPFGATGGGIGGNVTIGSIVIKNPVISSRQDISEITRIIKRELTRGTWIRRGR